MKQFNVLKKAALVALLAAAGSVQAQNRHPYSFGTMGTAYTTSNWFSDYVGLNVLCTSGPATVLGGLLYTTSYSGTTPWGGRVTTPLVNKVLITPQVGDEYGCMPITVDMTGKIALIERGPLSPSPCEFGAKALNAQNAHALAVVLYNEYPGEGPIGMAAGAEGGTVTIPVFMIGNTQGMAMAASIGAEVPVTMTITPWGIDTTNDLGFVPEGTAGWHNYAIPYTQLTSPSPSPYLGLDGAFVANYGKNDATNVKLAATLTFGSTMVHTDTSDVLPLFTGTHHLPTPDSVWTMFARNTYDVTATGVGKYSLKYTIISDSVDANPTDNTYTNYFYASDSVYSKGTYDFTNNVPLSTTATAPQVSGGSTDFTWGNMYFVNKHGASLSAAQFSCAYATAGSTGALPSGQTVPVVVFSWTDGLNGPLDGILEDGELNIVSIAGYTFDGLNDTSGLVFKTPAVGHLGGFGDTVDGSYHGPILLNDTTWYYVAVNLTSNLLLECDGQSNPYPRVYGRFYHPGDTTFDYSSLVYTSDFVNGNPLSTSPNQEQSPLPFPGVHLIASVDSFNYQGTKGIIPSVALIVNNRPDTFNLSVNQATYGASEVNLFPIPTSENLNVSVSLKNPAKTVTYTVLDGLGRFVTKEIHNNVQNETFVIPTTNFASGHYFLLITADGRSMSRKFIVAGK